MRRAKTTQTEPDDGPIAIPVEGGDEVRARHPALRLHSAHPALGLREEDEDAEHPVTVNVPRDLGPRWLSLPAAEQAQRMRDFMRALLEHAAARPDAIFWLAPWSPGATRAALRTLPEVSWDRGDGCFGPLTADVIEVLARRPCRDLRVGCDGRLFLEEDSTTTVDRTGIAIWVDPWKAQAMQAELERAWWPAAETRARERERLRSRTSPRDGGRVSRDTRAAILGWETRGARFVQLACVAVMTRLLADTWSNALLSLVILLTVLFSIDGLLTRWHRRS